MKKALLVILIVSVFCSAFSACSKNNNEQDTTTQTTTESAMFTETTEKQTEKQTEKDTVNKSDNTTTTTTTTTTTKKNSSNSLLSNEDKERLENSNAEVYFSDNPNNKYIVAISEKYGVKKENLVALIKVNAEFPSANVLEFSGKTDANGELIMTYDELKYVYNIDESNNSITKASKDLKDNDGLNYIEAKIVVTLVKEYFIPELPNLKANKRFPE